MTERRSPLPAWFPRRLLGLPGRAPADETPIEDAWASMPSPADRPQPPVSALLSEIERAASAVYVRHGLPDRPGHYARSDKAEAWRFLSEDLSAEERWALATAQKPGSGWRFGTLEDLGDHPDSPADVRRAAQMLRACRMLRARLAESGSPTLADEIEAALRLGSQWRELETETVRPSASATLDLASTEPNTPMPSLASGAEPLRLSVPKKTRPPRKSRKGR